MDNREIIVANTKTQKKAKITTDASTLAELKAAFDVNGIDYEGMTFTEGISKTQLIDDASQLPHDIIYKGQPTNNLVILLTNTKKKIASGAKKATEPTMSRKEILEYIKVNHLQDEVMRLFGNNATRVSTANLLTLINAETLKEEEPEGKKPEVETPKEDIDDTEYDNDYDEVKEEEEKDCNPLKVDDIIADADVTDLEDSLFLHIAMLVQKKSLSYADVKTLKDDLDKLLESMDAEKFSSKPTQSHEKVSSSDGSITEDDIDGMLDDLGM